MPSTRPRALPSSAKSVPGSLRVRQLRSGLAGPFDLDVEPGCPVAVTGPSGSGKSLFLRLVADLDPGDGEVSLGDLDRRSIPAPQWRSQVMWVPAEAAWWDDRVDAHFPKDRKDAARALADRLGVAADRFELAPIALSTGERQRLSLVRALVRDPPALLLDEPTSALDGDAKAKVEALLAERVEAGLVLILVTHDPEQGGRLAARRIAMRDRRFAAE